MICACCLKHLVRCKRSLETRDRRRGIRWGQVDRLEDLDFADDLCLLSEAPGEMQTKLGDLIKLAGKVGLTINIKKTKALRVNTNKTEPFMLGGESIEDVDSFVYLGSKVTKEGGAAQDVANEFKKQMVLLYNFTQ